MRNEIVYNLPDAVYFAADGISKHTLDQFEKNPWAFFRRLADVKPAPVEETPALAFGTAVHCAILTPDKLADTVVAQPEDITYRRGKAWDIFKASNAGKTILTQDQMDCLLGLTETLKKFEPAKEILEACSSDNREVATFWTHAKFPDLQLKSKLDFISDNGALVGDLKTCQDASPAGFAKACDQFAYARQAAFYLDAIEAATGKAPSVFAFLAIEKEYPFTPALYTFDADSDFINTGRIGYLLALRKYNEFAKQDFDKIPVGYSEHNLNLPAWNADLKRYKEFIAGIPANA